MLKDYVPFNASRIGYNGSVPNLRFNSYQLLITVKSRHTALILFGQRCKLHNGAKKQHKIHQKGDQITHSHEIIHHKDGTDDNNSQVNGIGKKGDGSRHIRLITKSPHLRLRQVGRYIRKPLIRPIFPVKSLDGPYCGEYFRCHTTDYAHVLTRLGKSGLHLPVKENSISRF